MVIPLFSLHAQGTYPSGFGAPTGVLTYPPTVGPRMYFEPSATSVSSGSFVLQVSMWFLPVPENPEQSCTLGRHPLPENSFSLQQLEGSPLPHATNPTSRVSRQAFSRVHTNIPVRQLRVGQVSSMASTDQ